MREREGGLSLPRVRAYSCATVCKLGGHRTSASDAVCIDGALIVFSQWEGAFLPISPFAFF